MAVVNKIAAYIKAGRLLHIIALAELLLLYILLHFLHIWGWVLERDTYLRFCILLPLLWSPVFPQLDARSRYQDYKMMKDYFWLYGFDVRLVKHFAKSRCQRDAVMVAAGDLGFDNVCRAYFKNCGYRWYHIFPDIIFEKPLVLLSWTFYRNTFFAKTYRPKIDYPAIMGRASRNCAVAHGSAA